MNKYQKGFGLGSFMILVLCVVGVVYSIKVVPYYMQNATIQNVLNEIVAMPGISTMTISEIRDSFDKRASISYITYVTSVDLDIAKDSTGVTLSASYNKTEKLFGNLTLVMSFNPTASK